MFICEGARLRFEEGREIARTKLLIFDLLPFYAILRSIPNKLLGVIAMFAAILVLLALPVLDSSKIRGISFKPAAKLLF
jgi:hypothetical protein